MKKLNKSKIAIIVLIFISFALIFRGIAETNSYKNGVEIEAEITEVKYNTNADASDDYANYVTYKYDGIEYKNVHARNTLNEPRIGKKITIVVDSRNPGKIVFDDIGGTLLVIGIIILLGVLLCIIIGCADKKLAKKNNFKSSL